MEMYEKLKLARKKAGLNQTQVGEACGGISKAAVSQWENENSDVRKIPKLEHLRIVAKLYGVKISTLVDDELNLDGGYDEYTLDDAPECESVYLLKINSMDLEGAQNGTVLQIEKWDAESAKDAVVVVFQISGHKRSMLLQLAYDGDRVCFVTPRLVNNGSPRSDTRYTEDDGNILGVVRLVKHDPKLWRGQSQK